MVRVGDTNQGKIYKLVSFQTDKCYIGSTTVKHLSRRLSQHKCDCKRQRPLTSKEITKFDDCKIVLIENYPCNDAYELRARERYWIEQEPNCVNKLTPSRTRKEYRDLHKEGIKQQCKDYYLNNTEKVKKKRMEYYNKTKQTVQCECGLLVLNCNLEKHKQSQQHKNLTII
jgi:hypothetical protein